MTGGAVNACARNNIDAAVTYIRKRFLAAIMVADMRLLASMGARVNSQGATLDETLVAILHRAMIRPLIGMYPVVAA